MKKPVFDPERILGDDIIKYDRQKLCHFTAMLCEYVRADVGAGVYRGGIYPENISIDNNGRVAVGEAHFEDWSGHELLFLPPELYWNGRRTPASDVYSIGLLLYYAVTGGKLPFEGECREPLLRRMGGDKFDIPQEAGRRLGEIIEKATRFKAAERYQSMEEMRVMAESCLKNLYLNGRSNAETLFSKNDDDLTDIEKMMVGIIEKEEDTPIPVPDKPTEPAEAVGEDIGEAEEGEPDGEIAAYETEDIPDEDIEINIPEFFAEEDYDLQPVIINRNKGAVNTVQYTKEAEKEKRTEDEIRHRRRRPVAVILVLCALLVIASILFNSLIKDLTESTLQAQQAAQDIIDRNSVNAVDDEPNAAEETTAPAETSEPVIDEGTVLDIPPDSEGLEYIPGQSVPEEEQPAEPVEHGYQLIVEDVSWTQAQERCRAMGGHLVVINDENEFAEITALAQQHNMEKVWIGGHRDTATMTMIWEDGSDKVYEKWGKGEPSFIDAGDNVSENYILLWNNRGWAFNDSRDDPCRDYPDMYSGKICYICEVGD